MNKNEFQNQISQFIIHDQYDQAFDYLEIYKRKFGKDTFYYLSYSDLLIQIEPDPDPEPEDESSSDDD